MPLSVVKLVYTNDYDASAYPLETAIERRVKGTVEVMKVMLLQPGRKSARSVIVDVPTNTEYVIELKFE